MAEVDVSTLESIFRMIQPADLLGAQKLAVANKSVENSLVRELLNVVFNMHGKGAYEVITLGQALDNITIGAEDEQLKQYKSLVNFYSTEGSAKKLSTSQNMALGPDGVTPLDNITFEQIIGKTVDLKRSNKRMGVVTCNSGFITPAVRNAERVEVFLNSVPSVIASRLTPLLEVEFEFNRSIGTKDAQPRFWSPGLLKFLMGSDSSLVADPESPTTKMMDLREGRTADQTRLRSFAGMEMFTSPQTLVNPSTKTNDGRYVDVLDPFRPFMSIENFSVNVSPTVGLYSYKKATLTLKLHDRSRMNEIADLVRPQVYQDALAAPTVWITYGWRHPDEPGNPYADFINGNMLVREAYGVINSQFAFDQLGQVTITLNLWTKGISELRTANISQDGTISVINELKRLAKSINSNLLSKGINLAEGTNKEIRSTMVLEAAERGAYPDMKKEEITKALEDLKASLLAPDPKVDPAALDSLKKELTNLNKTYLDFKQSVESQTSTIVNKQFEEAMTGADPFLPFAAKDTKRASELSAAPHPFTSLISEYNKTLGTASVTEQKSTINSKGPGAFRKKLVSLGKVMSVFLANTFKQVDAFDELQLFYYQFNDEAGKAAGTNISEFPIEMNVFLDQYREHVERKGSERVTIEEFMQLLFDAQVNDPRALGYGFRDFYAPYDPANKYDVKLAKGKTPEALMAATAKFQMPAPAVYVETTFANVPIDGTASSSTLSIDQLRQFELQKLVEGGPNVGRAAQYTRIMRIHVFDKANNPYKLPAKLLTGDDDTSFNLMMDEAKKSDAVKNTQVDVSRQINEAWATVIQNLKPDAKIDHNAPIKLSNDEIKRFISKMVPSIVYGSNASMVISANLASKQDPLLATTQMQAMAKKAGKPSVISTNGSDVGGLPLRIVPASMTLTTHGCPLLTYAQTFFVDFNTGTTIDNLYSITGLTHTISPGKFESQLTLTFSDAYGKFFGTHQRIIDYFTGLKSG